MLELQSAQYALLMGRPAVRLQLDGKEAYLCDMRRPLLDKGYVYLISLAADYGWEELLPPVVVPPLPGLSNAPMRLRGVTDDPAVLRIARIFQQTLDEKPERFQEGKDVEADA